MDQMSPGAVHVLLEAFEKEEEYHVWSARISANAVEQIRAHLGEPHDLMLVVVNDLQDDEVMLTVDAPRDVAYLDTDCMPRATSARLSDAQMTILCQEVGGVP